MNKPDRLETFRDLGFVISHSLAGADSAYTDRFYNELPKTFKPRKLMQTPINRDITKEVLDAFSAQGIRPGPYFSPGDFWWLRKNKIDIQRNIPSVQPRNNPGPMALDLPQMRELMTKYGPIDYVFLDGEPHQLRELAWQLQPNTVVTRGAIQTPGALCPRGFR